MPKGSGSLEPETKSPSSEYTFIHKPIQVEAWQNIRGNPIPEPDWLMEARRLDVVRTYPGSEDGALQIVTLEGKYKASHGDWLVQGVLREIYPCKPEAFKRLYEHDDGSEVE